MFNRDSRPPKIDTLIGKAAHVHGDVDFEGGLHLDGHVAGAVRSGEARDSSLSVSETGSIEGAVRVPNVVLNGTVKGRHPRARAHRAGGHRAGGGGCLLRGH